MKLCLGDAAEMLRYAREKVGHFVRRAAVVSEAVAAAAFRFIHGLVCAVTQIVGVEGAVRIDGDADAEADMDGVLSYNDGRTGCGHHRANSEAEMFEALQACKDDGK